MGYNNIERAWIEMDIMQERLESALTREMDEREDIEVSLMLALKEAYPLIRGERPAKCNFEEKLEIWQRWADDASG